MSALGRRKQGDQEVKVCPSYIADIKLSWVTRHPISKNKNNNNKAKPERIGRSRRLLAV